MEFEIVLRKIEMFQELLEKNLHTKEESKLLKYLKKLDELSITRRHLETINITHTVCKMIDFKGQVEEVATNLASKWMEVMLVEDTDDALNENRQLQQISPKVDKVVEELKRCRNGIEKYKKEYERKLLKYLNVLQELPITCSHLELVNVEQVVSRLMESNKKMNKVALSVVGKLMETKLFGDCTDLEEHSNSEKMELDIIASDQVGGKDENLCSLKRKRNDSEKADEDHLGKRFKCISNCITPIDLQNSGQRPELEFAHLLKQFENFERECENKNKCRKPVLQNHTSDDKLLEHMMTSKRQRTKIYTGKVTAFKEGNKPGQTKNVSLPVCVRSQQTKIRHDEDKKLQALTEKIRVKQISLILRRTTQVVDIKSNARRKINPMTRKLSSAKFRKPLTNRMGC